MTNEMTDGSCVLDSGVFHKKGKTMIIVGPQAQDDRHCVCFGSVLRAYGGVNEIQ